jgi:hypothetical protein
MQKDQNQYLSNQEYMKNKQYCDAISSGWWEKADIVITLKGIILKINFVTELYLNAMRKGGWEKNS